MNNLAGAWSPSGLGVVHLHTAPSQCDPAPMRPLPGTINCAIVWHRYLCFIRNAVVLCSVWASLHASLAVWDSQAASVHTHTHPHTHTHTHMRGCTAYGARLHRILQSSSSAGSALLPVRV